MVHSVEGALILDKNQTKPLWLFNKFKNEIQYAQIGKQNIKMNTDINYLFDLKNRFKNCFYGIIY